jgi:hypothetical protein
MRLTPISNGKPTEAEFNMYKNHLKSKRIKVPTGRDVIRQAKKTKKVLDNFVRTDEDVEREVRGSWTRAPHAVSILIKDEARKKHRTL